MGASVSPCLDVELLRRALDGLQREVRPGLRHAGPALATRVTFDAGRFQDGDVACGAVLQGARRCAPRGALNEGVLDFSRTWKRGVPAFCAYLVGGSNRFGA